MIFVTFGLRGVPLGKRVKKGTKIGYVEMSPKSSVFVQREAFGPLTKNMKF